VRVTPGSINAQLARDLQLALAALAKQQGMISTGRRIDTPADDPGGTAQALTVRSRQATNAQLQKNIQDARGNLAAAESTLSSAIEFLQQVREVAIQGANDTSDAPARQALGTQVDQILEAVVSIANTRGPGGSMLFGGQEVTVAPYTVTRNGSGTITAVAVNPRGINGSMPAEVAEGLTVAQGVPGTTAFGAMTDPTNVFDTLIRLRDALNTNNAVGVRTELDNVTAAHDRVTTASVLMGTRLGWLDTLESRLKDESLGLASRLSTIEDVDMAKAVTDMTQIQAFYEAGLAAGARLLQQSLVDFLR
jgi:flagellar hook-associated protein 3 FlgL